MSVVVKAFGVCLPPFCVVCAAASVVSLLRLLRLFPLNVLWLSFFRFPILSCSMSVLAVADGTHQPRHVSGVPDDLTKWIQLGSTTTTAPKFLEAINSMTDAKLRAVLCVVCCFVPVLCCGIRVGKLCCNEFVCYCCCVCMCCVVGGRVCMCLQCVKFGVSGSKCATTPGCSSSNAF
jgi:hypothetical protein